MYELRGKTLVFTDCHLGLRNGSVSRLKIVVMVFKQIMREVRAKGISQVIFVGDAFHDRKSIDVNVLNVGNKLFTKLAEMCDVYMVVGNHDCFYKTNTTVSSINIFDNNPRIHVVSTMEEFTINGQTALFVPWLGDVSQCPRGKFDLMFGHFDIGVQYLVASYIEDHARADMTNDSLIAILSKDELISEKIGEGQLDPSDISMTKQELASSNLIGDFVEVVREGGVIYAGHIHNHKEFYTRGRRFIFVGSPYQQTFGEMDSVDGYYVLDESNNPTFVKTVGIPVHVKVKMSDILKAGVDKYDFSFIKGNIVKRVYDVEVPRAEIVRINQKIQENEPYEEISSDFEIARPVEEKVNNETLEVIKKSKLDYIMKYIDSMDDKVLAEKRIEKGKLFDILKEYYLKAEGTSEN